MRFPIAEWKSNTPRPRAGARGRARAILRLPRPAAQNGKSEIGNRKSGFTLIEILLAIGILSLGITAVLFMFTVGVQSHRRARDRTQAALLADTVINQISADLAGQTLPAYYKLDSGSLQLWDPDNNAPRVHAEHADYPGFTYSVDFFPIYGGDFYRVTVTVRWGKPPEGGGTDLDPRDSEQFVTIVRKKNF